MSRKKRKTPIRSRTRGKKTTLGSFGRLLKKALLEANKPQQKPKQEMRKARLDNERQVAAVDSEPKVSVPTDELPRAEPTRPGGTMRLGESTYTQYYTNTSEPMGEAEVVVGVDFGTSCTKVCFQDIGSGTSYLIDFQRMSEFTEHSYLLQTKLFVDEKSGTVSLSNGPRSLQEIKIKLIDSPDRHLVKFDDETCLMPAHIAAAYLGLVIRLARKYFGTRYGKRYRDRKIVWQLNLGMPARSYDNSKLVKTYRNIGLVAWELSLATKEIDAAEVLDLFTKAERTTAKPFPSEISLQSDEVTPIPEVIAGFMGYSRSPIRQNNQLHLLVDIGASTVDTTTFVLSQDRQAGTDRFPLLTAEIAHIGAYRLVEHRLKEFEKRLRAKISEALNSANAITAPPEVDRILLEIDGEEADRHFWIKYRKLLNGSLMELKKNRYPRVTNQGDIPVLCSGGGSKVEQYKKQIEKLNIYQKPYGIPPLRIVEFEANGDGLELPTFDVDLTRIGVAYGLSFSADDFGKITVPSKISSIPEDKPRTNEPDWRFDPP